MRTLITVLFQTNFRQNAIFVVVTEIIGAIVNLISDRNSDLYELLAKQVLGLLISLMT